MGNLEKIMLHPIRMRIIQLLGHHESMTVAALAEAMGDIPRSTIYHHIGILHDNEIAVIVKEQKIRGTYEREYALNNSTLQIRGEDAGQTVLGLLLQLFADFSGYFAKPEADPAADGLFLSINTLQLSDGDLERFKDELYGVVQKYMNLPAAYGGRTRRISIVSAPCGEGDNTEEKGRKQV